MKREKNKFYTATKEIKGVTYTAQFNGVRPALEAIDRYKSNEIGFYEYLLSNTIVDPPGLQIEDFDSIQELRAVVNFASSVMSGRFREAEEEQSNLREREEESGALAAGSK